MAKKLGHISKYKDGQKSIVVNLSLIEFEDDGIHFIYSPDLDLTGYGKREEDAKDSFNLAMEEFLTYTSRKGTIIKVLTKLGWKVTKKEKLSAPSLSELVRTRSYLEEILTEKDFRKTSTSVAIPA